MTTQWLGLGIVIVFALLMIGHGFSARRRDQARVSPWKLREIPAFEKLAQGVGLAVEAGQRLHLSLGRGGVFNLPGAATFLGLSVLNRVANTAAVSDHPPVATSGESVQAILSQDVLRGSQALGSMDGGFDPGTAQLTGLTPFSYAGGALPIVYDQDASVNVLTGSFGAEVGLIADAVDRVDGMMLAGSEDLSAQAILYASTSDLLIGEELFAAGAYLQAGPAHRASLAAQDVIRIGLIIALIIGAVLKLVGVV